jgi:hypothetical protein
MKSNNNPKKGKKKAVVIAKEDEVPVEEMNELNVDPNIYQKIMNSVINPELIQSIDKNATTQEVFEKISGTIQKNLSEANGQGIPNLGVKIDPSIFAQFNNLSAAMNGPSGGGALDAILKAKNAMDSQQQNSTQSKPKAAAQGQIYQAFNKNMSNTIEWLSKKIPDSASEYMNIKQIFEQGCKINPKNALKTFRMSIEKHEHCLVEFNEKNLNYFLAEAPHIKALNELKISENHKKLKIDDWKALWKSLATLNNLSKIPDMLPEELFDVVESKVNDLTKTEKWQKIGKNLIENPTSTFLPTFSLMAKEIQASSDIMQKVQEFSAKKEQEKNDEISPEVPDNEFTRRYSQFNKHKNEELEKFNQ